MILGSIRIYMRLFLRLLLYPPGLITVMIMQWLMMVGVSCAGKRLLLLR